MSDYNHERESMSRALSEPDVLAQLTELAEGLHKLTGFLADLNIRGSRKSPTDDDYQAHCGSSEASIDQHEASSGPEQWRESNTVGTGPVPDESSSAPSQVLQENCLPVGEVSGMNVPYGSLAPYPLASDSTRDNSDFNPEEKESLEFSDNVSQVSQDGRVTLSPNPTGTNYLRWTKIFCERLWDVGGAFRVQDIDQAGRIKLYHYNHINCRLGRRGEARYQEGHREPLYLPWKDPHHEDEALFHVPPAIWPPDGLVYRRLFRNPVLRAPWKRLIIPEFSSNISAIFHTWKNYQAEYVDPYINIGGPISRTEDNPMRQVLSKIEGTIQILQHTQEQFDNQQAETVALRDGLFAASAVRESKTSTGLAKTSTRLAAISTHLTETSIQLAENIRLLTYVSIFYLPLSFCVTIWSTSDALGYSTLIYTTAIVRFTTYIIVLNINHLSAWCTKRYGPFKRNVVEKMKQDGAWQAIGTFRVACTDVLDNSDSKLLEMEVDAIDLLTESAAASGPVVRVFRREN
ncbi:MAG: hypothetical protein Q9170_005989 [Blastenia crenularia]